MNHHEEIRALKAERDQLKAQLTMKGLDKDREHDIQQRIIATDNQITAIYALLKPEASSQTPKAEDSGSFMCIPTTLFSMAGCDATNPRSCIVSFILFVTAIASCWNFRPGVADTGIWVITSVIILSISNKKVPVAIQCFLVVLAVTACYYFRKLNDR